MVLTIFATILFLFLTLHDLVHFPPLTNIKDLKDAESESRRFTDVAINGLCGLIPLALIVWFGPHQPTWSLRTIKCIYGLLLLGAFLSWWVPYFFGSSEEHRKAFEKFKNTHHFLPACGENIVPNTFHVIMHIMMLVCFILSLSL